MVHEAIDGPNFVWVDIDLDEAADAHALCERLAMTAPDYLDDLIDGPAVASLARRLTARRITVLVPPWHSEVFSITSQTAGTVFFTMGRLGRHRLPLEQPSSSAA